VAGWVGYSQELQQEVFESLVLSSSDPEWGGLQASLALVLPA